jgi:hypothetical protein
MSKSSWSPERERRASSAAAGLRAFAAAVRELGAVWLSNEGYGVLSGVGVGAGDASSMLLVRDGHDVLARTDPHGVWVEWRR